MNTTEFYENWGMKELAPWGLWAFERIFERFNFLELSLIGGIQWNWIHKNLLSVTSHAFLAKNITQAEKNEGIWKSLPLSAPQVITCINTQERTGYCKTHCDKRQVFYDKLPSEITGVCIGKIKECKKILPWQSFKPFFHPAAWPSAQGCPWALK